MGNPLVRLTEYIPLTVGNGSSTSDSGGPDNDGVVDGRPYAMYGLVIPSSFDGTTIGFSVSADGTTYQTLYDNTATVVSMTVAASRSYDLPVALAVWPFWKLTTGTSQTGATAFIVIAKS